MRCNAGAAYCAPEVLVGVPVPTPGGTAFVAFMKPGLNAENEAPEAY